MNRLLLVLNIAAVGSIMATRSSDLLTAISPYGGKMTVAPPAAAPAPVDTAATRHLRPASAQSSRSMAIAERP